MDSKCPSDADLDQLLSDRLTEEQVGEIATHIDNCPQCQAKLDAKAPYDRTDYWADCGNRPPRNSHARVPIGWRFQA